MRPLLSKSTYATGLGRVALNTRLGGAPVT